MSIEIYRKDPINDDVVAAVASCVADILKATGVTAAVAHTTGETAATYAAELLLATGGFTGDIPNGQVSDADFIDTLKNVAAISVDPSLEAAYNRKVEKALFGGAIDA